MHRQMNATFLLIGKCTTLFWRVQAHVMPKEGVTLSTVGLCAI